jgi:nicotinate-nucleotide--dimethylbenzimidazole phosphoribosyltransferase
MQVPQLAFRPLTEAAAAAPEQADQVVDVSPPAQAPAPEVGGPPGQTEVAGLVVGGAALVYEDALAPDAPAPAASPGPPAPPPPAGPPPPPVGPPEPPATVAAVEAPSEPVPVEAQPEVAAVEAPPEVPQVEEPVYEADSGAQALPEEHAQAPGGRRWFLKRRQAPPPGPEAEEVEEEAPVALEPEPEPLPTADTHGRAPTDALEPREPRDEVTEVEEQAPSLSPGALFGEGMPEVAPSEEFAEVPEESAQDVAENRLEAPPRRRRGLLRRRLAPEPSDVPLFEGAPLVDEADAGHEPTAPETPPVVAEAETPEEDRSTPAAPSPEAMEILPAPWRLEPSTGPQFEEAEASPEPQDLVPPRPKRWLWRKPVAPEPTVPVQEPLDESPPQEISLPAEAEDWATVAPPPRPHRLRPCWPHRHLPSPSPPRRRFL